KYQVILTVGSQESCECELDQTSDFIVAIGSNKMGEGDPALGTALMKAFIFALTKQNQFPTTMLFFNSGAYLTCQDSDVLEDLKTLESKGVEIFTCGTCLNFYGLNEKLAIGSVTNMYDIVEKMEKAGKVVKP
ncbi:MAG: sulfurtransferase-like selenium metabolism protein YedF, partial [Firmicutes bacterium]|nr:sulfurtransferase-like selenium metabolism protein YedF [Bacillota bacterium]